VAVIPFDERAFVTPRVLCKDLGEEAILLDLETETYFGLNAVGNRLFKLLTGAGTIREAFDTMLAEYEVPAEVLERDMVALIDDLVGRGLLRIGSA
jgi:hypothetical protein